MRQDYVDYINSSFAKARVETFPFPHLIIDNVIPPDLYAAMERASPTNYRWLMAAIAATMKMQWNGWPGTTWDKIKHMFNILIKPELNNINNVISQPVLSVGKTREGSPLLGDKSREWQKKFYGYVDLVHNHVVSLFQEHTKEYAAKMVEQGLYPSMPNLVPLEHEFCLRTKGWSIPPHTHHLSQAIQWMLYFPLPGSEEWQGTQLFRLTESRNIPVKDLFGTTWFEKGVELVKSVPYRKNTLIAFLNTPISVHASAQCKDGDVPRRYLFVGAWFDKQYNVDKEGAVIVSNGNYDFQFPA